MVTGSKWDEIGASMAPGKKRCSRVRVQKGRKYEQVWHQVKNTTAGQ